MPSVIRVAAHTSVVGRPMALSPTQKLDEFQIEITAGICKLGSHSETPQTPKNVPIEIHALKEINEGLGNLYAVADTMVSFTTRSV
jgi:hypothetical protein